MKNSAIKFYALYVAKTDENEKDKLYIKSFTAAGKAGIIDLAKNYGGKLFVVRGYNAQNACEVFAREQELDEVPVLVRTRHTGDLAKVEELSLDDLLNE